MATARTGFLIPANRYLSSGARSDGQNPFQGRVDDVWLFDEALSQNEIQQVMAGNFGCPLAGDFDCNGELNVDDVNALIEQIIAGTHDSAFDLSADQLVDGDDLTVWVKDLKGTWFGDVNLDGEFNSGDLVAAFTEGEYEDAVAGNSGWDTGDWDADGDFTSSDFVIAFTDGGYEQGPVLAAKAVPEPAGAVVAYGRLDRNLSPSYVKTTRINSLDNHDAFRDALRSSD